MCGRYTLKHSTEEVAARFAVQQIAFDLEPRFNIAPSQPIAVITQGQNGANAARILDGFKWGLVPSWAKDAAIGNRMINARAETLLEKPSFRTALKRRRCLIPADGFYEWKRDGKTKGATKQPMRIHESDDSLFAFAGLWEEWKQPDGELLRTATIITTSPNELMSGIHDRMPAILSRDDEAFWLDADADEAPQLLKLLRSYPDEALRAHPVSTQVNSPGFDAPSCITSIAGDGGACGLNGRAV